MSCLYVCFKSARAVRKQRELKSEMNMNELKGNENYTIIKY